MNLGRRDNLRMKKMKSGYRLDPYVKSAVSTFRTKVLIASMINGITRIALINFGGGFNG